MGKTSGGDRQNLGAVVTMSVLRNIADGVRSLFRRNQADHELDQELHEFLEMATEEKIKQGMNRQEALREVRLERGSLQVTREIVRSAGWESLVETFWQDLRFGLRTLRKNRGFTAVAVLTLALGIGATTAIFSLVEGVLLRPLPFRDADRLVLLGEHLGGRPGMSVRASEITTYTSAAQAFSSLGGYITASFELSGGAQPEQIDAARLNSEMFPTLGVEPILGRAFTRQEDDARQPLAVISYALWNDRFHRDPHVLGNSIVLDRKPYSVIGVMPQSFEFPLGSGGLHRTQLWVPLSLTPDELSDQHSGFWGYQMIARLKDGVSLRQATQDADRVAQQIMRDFPPSMSAIHIQGDARPLREDLVADVRPVLQMLFLAVAVVLLIACVNVSGLLLVRAIRQRREYAVRLVIGASPGRIIREAAVQGLLLSIIAGLLGLALAATAIRSTLHLLPDSMPRMNSVSINPVVAAFALIVAISSGVLCSLAPAFAALRTNSIESLKEGAHTGSGSASHARVRSALVVSEVAIALVLLTVSGVFLRSLQKMQAVDPGFRADHAVIAGYELPLAQYPVERSVRSFNRAVVDKLSSQPGVIAVAISNAVAASDVSPQSAFTVEGVSAENWKLKFAAFTSVYGDYFGALGIPLLEGRTFTGHDNSSSPLVVIVSQSMAKDCWPGQNAIGKRMHVGNPRKPLPWATVIGVVADTKMPRDAPSVDQWYTPMDQPATLYGAGTPGNLSGPPSGYITMRSALDPRDMSHTLRSAIAEIDPLLALQDVQPVTEAVSAIEAPRHFITGLITVFAVVAFLLAITGIYAVMAFSASQRGQEIAIRITLGAQRIGIAKLVLVSGAKLALLGCALGVLGSLAVSRLISSFLFDVSATDPLIYMTCVLIMTSVALLASILPAARAACAHPMDALRSA
ncbi:MAG: ABC transporter permease [Candidatus Acidiferrum sp.]